MISAMLDKEGSFLNRLRWENGSLVISLNSVVDGNDFSIEPTCSTTELKVGRLKFKSMLREIYSSEGSSAGASVLFESGALTVTDSFSSSSRYGVVLRPFSAIDMSSWLFRANNGQVSGGLIAQKLSPPGLGLIRFETDLALCVGSSIENTAASWFDDKPLLPLQPLLNPAIELRIASNPSCRAGRGMLKAAREDFSIALSVLAAGSLPLYTEAGGMIRFFSSLGWNRLKLSGSFLLTDDNYICPGGELMKNTQVVGLNLIVLTNPGECELEFETGFSRRVRRKSVVPTRYIGQKYELDQAVKLSSDIMAVKLSGEYGIDYAESGERSEQVAGELDMKIFINRFTLSAGYEIESVSVNRFWEQPSHVVDYGLILKSGKVKFSLGGKAGTETKLQAGLDVYTDKTDFSFDIEADTEWKPRFSIGFDTYL